MRKLLPGYRASLPRGQEVPGSRGSSRQGAAWHGSRCLQTCGIGSSHPAEVSAGAGRNPDPWQGEGWWDLRAAASRARRCLEASLESSPLCRMRFSIDLGEMRSRIQVHQRFNASLPLCLVGRSAVTFIVEMFFLSISAGRNNEEAHAEILIIWPLVAGEGCQL